MHDQNRDTFAPKMIVTSNILGRDAPPRQPGHRLLAAIDVEWSKNYRIKGGNVPFCFSVVWLSLPADGIRTIDTDQFWYASAYIEDAGERGQLITAADSALRSLASRADLIAGHQLCSDLAVLTAAAGNRTPAIEAASAAWRQRRQALPGQVAFLDTRYDAGHVLACQSRRLVDVCADLGLDVTQPELGSTSMTALHRRWLELGDTMAQEKITVLNLRHSLSTAIVAARASGLAHWQAGLNVNQLLASQLGTTFGWTASPAFTALLGGPGVA
jgi:hypothetical protein